MRIGIVDRSVAGWTAGGTFSRSLLAALASAVDARDELFFITDKEDVPGARRLRLGPPIPLPGEAWLRDRLGVAKRVALLPGETRLRTVLRLRNPADEMDVARRAGLDVLLPATFVPPFTGRLETIGWIPDFQHRHLPHYFAPAERRQRDRAFFELARRSSRILLSSQDALRDFAAFAPAFAAKARVVPFVSILAGSKASNDPGETVRRYHLPPKFVLVANQFWQHKNHGVVVRALEILARRGLRIACVLAGLPVDYRDRENAAFSALLQQIAAANLREQVAVLGQLPRREVVDLLRACAVVLQPSRFEGWSTTIEDAKALGRPVVCSDLAVHREQAPGALGFFGCDDAGVLADLLQSVWPRLEPGPSPDEEAALAHARVEVLAQGRALLAVCRELCGD